MPLLEQVAAAQRRHHTCEQRGVANSFGLARGTARNHDALASAAGTLDLKRSSFAGDSQVTRDRYDTYIDVYGHAAEGSQPCPLSFQTRVSIIVLVRGS